MIRVAFVDQSGDLAGGAEESLALLLAQMPPDIDPVVVLFSDGAYARRLRERGLAVEVVGMPAVIATTKREKLTASAMGAAPLAALRLWGTLRRLRADLIYTNSMKAHVIGAPAARIGGLPCVMHVRDIVDGRARAALRLIGARCSRRRIAISRAVANALALPNTDVVANPLDLGAYDALPGRTQARRALGIGSDEPLIAIVGRINRWKGHDRFIRIASRVARTSSARFAVVGEPLFRDADFVAELHALAATQGIADRLTFLPWQADPRPVYAAIDVLCNCSTNEPFGRTIIEAAAAGVPTVCFDDGGAAEAVVDGLTGTVVPSGDEAAFARALSDYVEDPQRRAEAGAAARRDSLRFDARTHARRVFEIVRAAAA